MARTAPRAVSIAVAVAALVLLAACGTDPDETTDTAAAAPSVAPTTLAPVATTAPPATEAAATTPEATDAAPDATDAPDDTPTDDTDSTAEAPADTEPAEGALDKPEVSLPDELPTELVVTDLTEGEGPAAIAGDTVVVHYVGVRAEDGVEFDNSYETGAPFSVVLGAGNVIQGWDEGLVGIKQGGRRQLDIPAELGYGETGAGDVIRPGDALSFVIDAVAVIGKSDPTDAPDVSVAAGENIEELEFDDLVVGKGAEVEDGNSLAMHIIAFRADTGEQLLSTWEAGTPDIVTYDPQRLLPALYEGLAGVHAGGRRMITIPYEASFGTAGNDELGLPPEVDLVVVVDVLAVY